MQVRDLPTNMLCEMFFNYARREFRLLGEVPTDDELFRQWETVVDLLTNNRLKRSSHEIAHKFFNDYCL